MRAYIELDGEAAGWGPTRMKIGELKRAGYIVLEYNRGDHMKDLELRGVPASDEAPHDVS